MAISADRLREVVDLRIQMAALGHEALDLSAHPRLGFGEFGGASHEGPFALSDFVRAAVQLLGVLSDLARVVVEKT